MEKHKLSGSLLPGCCICNMAFTTQGYVNSRKVRVPLILECGHSSCENCILSCYYSKHPIVCNVCLKESPLPASSNEEDIKAVYPVSKYLLGLWTKKTKEYFVSGDSQVGFTKKPKKKIAPQTKKPKKTCHECEYLADSFCDSCVAAYCHPCFQKVHKAAKVLKSHKAVALAGSSASILPFEEPICEVHTGSTLAFFCKQCLVAICPSCLLHEHNGHTMQSIDDKNKELVEDIVATYARVSNTQQIMKASSKVAKETLISPKQEKDGAVETLEQRISEHFIKLHAYLELIELRLHKSLISSSSVVSLNSAIDQLNDQTEKIRCALLKTKKILRNKCSGNYFSILRELSAFEKLPAVLVCTGNAGDETSLSIDQGIFKALDDHITLLNTNSQSYSLKMESEVAEKEIPNVPKMTVDDARTLLYSHSKDSIVTLSGYQDYDRPDSKCSSSSNHSSISSLTLDSSQFLSPPDDLVPGMSIAIKVSHVGSPSNFYIQRSGVESRLSNLQKQFKRAYANYIHWSKISHHQAGQLYMMLGEDLDWCRCQLLDFVGSSEARILQIDYGVTETVYKAKLMAIPDFIAQIPPLATKCSLVNCYPKDGDQWCAKVTPLMMRMLEGPGETWVTIVDKNEINTLIVQLNKNHETSYTDIGEALVFQGLAVYGTSNSILKVPQNTKGPTNKLFPPQPFLTMEDLGGTNIELAYVVNPHHFYISIPSGDFKTFRQNFHKEFNKTNDRKTVHYPAFGMGVASRTPYKYWERAIVMEMLPEQFVRVFYIDSGLSALVKSSELKTLSRRHFQFPPQAYRCSLCDIAPVDGSTWSDAAITMLMSFKRKPLRIANPQKTQYGVSILLMRLGAEADICVNALLVREKLAKSIGPYADIVEYPKAPCFFSPEDPIIIDQMEELKIATPTSTPLKGSEKSPSATKEMDNRTDDLLVKVNNNVHVKVRLIRFENPGKFFVGLVQHDDDYKGLFKSIQEHYNQASIPIKEWTVEEKCAVKVNGEWKRGFVESVISENYLLVKLVDDAEQICISTKHGIIAPLDTRYCKTIDRAFECALGGIEPAASSSWTGVAVSMMKEFIAKDPDNIYITKMKSLGTEDKLLRVQLFLRSKVEQTAVDPEYHVWKSLNHQLRMSGVAKPDAFTKWDSQGNIIDNVVDNPMEDETELLIKFMKDTFHSELDGRIDLSRLLVNTDGFKTTWMHAKPLSNLTFVGKPTYVGKNCDIFLHDTLSVTLVLNQINEETNRLCEGTLPPAPPIDWEVGDICIAKYHLDENWYRGQIVKTNISFLGDTPIHLVKFVDYGNEEFTSRDDIRPATGVTMRPLQAHVCYFDNLAPIGDTWSSHHLEGIHKMIVDKNCRVELRKLSTGFLAIRSLILPDGKNAMEEIISRRLAVYRTYPGVRRAPELPDIVSRLDIVSPEENCEAENTLTEAEASKYYSLNWLNRYDQVDRYEIPENVFQLLKVPEEINTITIFVQCIIAPDLFLIQLSDKDNTMIKALLEEFEIILKDMQTESESQPLLEPPFINKTCVCKFSFDGRWYRAIIIQDMTDDEGDSVMVQYVDYGNVETVPVDRIRQVKDEWLRIPAISIPAQIGGYKFCSEISSEEAIKKLSTVLLVDCHISANILERGKNLCVELKDDTGRLVYQDLIDQKYLLPVVE